MRSMRVRRSSHPDYGSYPGSSPLDAPSNRYYVDVSDRGDVEAALAQADIVVENTYETPRAHQAYLEPHSALVSIEGGRVHVWASSKVPHATRDSLAFTAGISPEEIVVHHSHIGGDFGGKGTPLDLPICYFPRESEWAPGADGRRLRRGVYGRQPPALDTHPSDDRRHARRDDHRAPCAISS